jgi:hypothetical protein
LEFVPLYENSFLYIPWGLRDLLVRTGIKKMRFCPLESTIYAISGKEEKNWLDWEAAGLVDPVAGFKGDPRLIMWQGVGEVVIMVRAGGIVARQVFDQCHLREQHLIDYAVMTTARDAVVVGQGKGALDG